MLQKIEYQRVSRDEEDGVEVIFTYDDDVTDTYEVYGEPDNSIILNLIGQEPPPEFLVLQLRHLTGSTVH